MLLSQSAILRGRELGLPRPTVRGFGRSMRPNTVVHASYANGAQSLDNEEPDDYYALLGVPPSASQADIKKAYYNVMREFHPDLSQAEEDTTEFCTFLNEVYETLSDPDRRAAYDEIAGLSLAAINPFMDRAFEADKVFVDEYTCIGCRNCNCVAPKSFGMEEEFGRARVYQQHGEPDSLLQEAIDTCPVNCIHWVTAPQLTLLENQMAKMERTSAWIVANGGGGKGGASVFLEASTAWEKQQAKLRARLAAQTSWMASLWQPAGTASTYASAARANGNGGGDGEQRGTPSDEIRRKAAASMADAARKWRDIKRTQRNKREATCMLTAGRED